MTYFDRTDMVQFSQPSAEHTNFIFSILRRACEVWSAGAPKRESEIADDLAHKMRWKKHEVIEEAFVWLKNNHDGNFFPKPAKWQKAFEYAENNVREMITSAMEKCEDYAGRQIPLWEKELIIAIKDFSQMSFMLKAKEERYSGIIFDNGVIPPFGLNNFFAEIFSHQIFILKIWPQDPLAKRPARIIEEFNFEQAQDFRKWLHSIEFADEIKKFGAIKTDLFRESDLEIIKNRKK